MRIQKRRLVLGIRWEVTMSNYQEEKRIVRSYFEELEKSTPENVQSVLKKFTSEHYSWQGVYPFREQEGSQAVAETFWVPLLKSIKKLQRRQDIFMGGANEISGETWVMSMGHFMGLFDEDWMGVRRTGKMINLRYAEFHCVENGKITKTGLFVDLIGFMIQAGVNHCLLQRVHTLFTQVQEIMMACNLKMPQKKRGSKPWIL
jgi:hypothetical protein